MKNYLKKFMIMFLMAFAVIGVGVIQNVSMVFADEIDSNTKLLMHMNDLTFKDECGHAITNNGVTFDTSNKVLGNGSAYFNGTNANLHTPDSNDFKFYDNIDFTIDFWVKWSNTTNSYQHIIGTTTGWSGCTGYIRIWGSNSGRVGTGKVSIGREGTDPELASNTSLTPNVWTHVAVVRHGTTLYIFINGKLDATKNNSTTNYNFSNNGMDIGVSKWDGSNGYLGCNLSELRISNVARWTADFTPSSVPYGESADDTIVNIAHAKGDNTNNAGGGVTIIFKGLADATLSVVKTADVQSVYVGDTFTYTIVVTNTGSKTAKAVVFNDSAPNHINFLVDSITTTQGKVGPSSTSKNIIINIGDIEPSGTVTIKIPSNVIL